MSEENKGAEAAAAAEGGDAEGTAEEQKAAEAIQSAFRHKHEAAAEGEGGEGAEEAPMSDGEKKRTLSTLLNFLDRGVEVWKHHSAGGVAQRRVLWLHKEAARLCVTHERQTNKAPHLIKGLYLRDIASIKAGKESYAFKHSSSFADVDADTCFTVVGSERSFSFELRGVSGSARDFFVVGLTLLVDSVLDAAAREQRARRKWQNAFDLVKKTHTPSMADVALAADMQHLLSQGIRIVHHRFNGSAQQSTMGMNAEGTRLLIGNLDMPDRCEGLDVSDVAETRVGHSYILMLRDSNESADNCISIIGSERTMDIELPSASAADMFVRKFRAYVLVKKGPRE